MIDSRATTCCIVGGGPGGMVLALLLARKGIQVTLLEMHGDFDRDFRGDVIHPSTMELMDQLGVAMELLSLPHTKAPCLRLNTDEGWVSLASFASLRTKFPYLTIMPQAKFLDFVASKASRYPNFSLIMGAMAQDLVIEDGVVRGVRYRASDGMYTLRAQLTVGADGRFSKIAQLAGFMPVKSANSMDILWFRIPRKPEDGEGMQVRFRSGGGMALLDRGEQWQVGYMFPKGSYQELRAAGIGAFRERFCQAAPLELADRADKLQDWKQVSVLSVESSRCPLWHRPGLLVIGDAAHVMSPIAGVGINYAVQDAVEAANVLTGPLLKGEVSDRDLANVQRRREWPTKVIQSFQGFIARQLVAPALAGKRATSPIFLKVPLLRGLPARLIAFGPRRTRLRA